MSPNHALQRTENDKVHIAGPDSGRYRLKREADIFCPKCTWRPQASDRWACLPSCGTEWNTFWTRGVCPGCGQQWTETQCLECGEFSPHEAWYHYPDPQEETESTDVTQEHVVETTE
jgi:hypothetical protein